MPTFPGVEMHPEPLTYDRGPNHGGEHSGQARKPPHQESENTSRVWPSSADCRKMVMNELDISLRKKKRSTKGMGRPKPVWWLRRSSKPTRWAIINLPLTQPKPGFSVASSRRKYTQNHCELDAILEVICRFMPDSC